MSRFKRIVVLTGAGISAESGIATFRDRDGIWAKVDVMDVATPQGFARNPQLVLDFYNTRRKDSRDARPNAAHLALARLETEHAANTGGQVLLVTQNIDLLHEAAGSRSLIHMHGQGNQSLCNHCQARHPWGQEDLRLDQRVPVLRQGRRPAPGRGVVRRDALPHGAHLRGPRRRPTCSSPSAPAATSIPRAASWPRPAATAPTRSS